MLGYQGDPIFQGEVIRSGNKTCKIMNFHFISFEAENETLASRVNLRLRADDDDLEVKLNHDLTLQLAVFVTIC